jgi:hypothetical protein
VAIVISKPIGERMESIPSTGFFGFDESLKAVFAIDQEAVASIVSAAKGNIKEIVEKVDRQVIRAAVALEDENLFASFTRPYPQQLTPVLTDARRITRAIFGDILQKSSTLNDLDEASQEPSDQAYLENLDTVNGVSATSEWRFDRKAGSVVPGLRLSATNPGDKVLLNVYLDWDDAVYLCYRIMQELYEDSKNIEFLSPELRKSTNLKERYGDRVAKRMSNMIADLKSVRATLCELGFSREEFAPD